MDGLVADVGKLSLVIARGAEAVCIACTRVLSCSGVHAGREAKPHARDPASTLSAVTLGQPGPPIPTPRITALGWSQGMGVNQQQCERDLMVDVLVQGVEPAAPPLLLSHGPLFAGVDQTHWTVARGGVRTDAVIRPPAPQRRRLRSNHHPHGVLERSLWRLPARRHDDPKVPSRVGSALSPTWNAPHQTGGLSRRHEVGLSHRPWPGEVIARPSTPPVSS